MTRTPEIATLKRDTSQRRDAEARLRHYEAIVNASGDAILGGTPDGIIEVFNPAAERLFGYSAQEMIGQPVERVLPAAGLDADVTLSPLCADDGEILGVAAIVRDVTERTRDAARLTEAHNRFAGAFSAAATGMALVAPDGRMIEVNDALCRLLGRDAQTIGNMTFQQLTHPEDLDDDLAELQRILAGEIDSYQLTKRYLLPDGGIIWGLLTVSAVRGEAGARPLYLVSQIHDVTDRKTAEGELRRYAAQLEALAGQDPVTGLANRRTFELALTEELAVFEADRTPVSLLVVVTVDDVFGETASALARGNRAKDLVAHLGDGLLAVLLREVDAGDADAIATRLADLLPAGADVWAVSAHDGEDPDALLRRAVEQADGTPAARRAMDPSMPSGIDRLLDLARRQLGMPVAFLTRIDGDDYVIARAGGDHDRLGLGDGDRIPLAGTNCARMVDGRIGPAVGDLAEEPHTRDLATTRESGLRAYAGVPVRLASGRLYGTLCTVDFVPHPETGEREVELLRFLSTLISELIEADEHRERAWRAETAASGVKTLLGALQARDFYTGEHSKEVVALAGAVACRLGLAADARRDIEQVALLHDIGKVGIPDAILQKQGPLDEQEWQLMRQHPVVGERIVAGTPGLEHLAPAMRAEHERFDGRGYPDGLAGEAIPMASRITFACDAFHAMTSDRPYRPAMTVQRAQEELRTCAGTQFDPHVVDALLVELGAEPPR